MKQHELSAAYPAMPDAELAALSEDIKAHGLHQSIVVYKGAVLDGWHRYLACQKAGVNPRSIEYKGSDPAAFVESANEHRRHATASQRAFAKVSVNEWRFRGKTSANGSNEPFKTTAQMADEAKVGIETIKRAKAVHANGSEALKDAVKEGEITVDKAAVIAKLPKKEQARAMKEKPEKKLAVIIEDDNAPDLVKELERADKEIRSLQALVESLQAPDLAKQLTKLHLKYEQLEARLLQCNTTRAEAEKQARYQSGLLAKIRTALKVKKDSDILAALKA